jgi:arylsulfatase A-like enzyme
MDRSRLPAFAARERIEVASTYDEQSVPFSLREQARAPDGAPNVLLILIDDMGFGAPSPFGGPCRMPTADALAANGLRYTRFHTCALCAPTRAALLTGRNHHSVGMGGLPEMGTPAPGYDGMRPLSAATMAQVLKYNGYATGCFGKWHQMAPWESTAAGPFDRWPTSEGFDRFYGFLGGACNQFRPTLVRDTTFIDPPTTEEEGYHLSEDLVDQAIEWVREVRAFGGTKPWFAYVPFGATHSPIQVPDGWVERHRGRFAHGWTEQREITLARQKKLGVVPPDTELAPWSPMSPAWGDLDPVQQRGAERIMEAYAAFAEHMDAQVGRLVDSLRDQGELDNTIVLYILGDNGASPAGGLCGYFNEMTVVNALKEDPRQIVDNLDAVGGPRSYPEYAIGWALAMDTPYQWTKGVASHYGGTRNGLIVHWPDGIAARDEVRHQWHHVIDVMPTLLEAIGVPHPDAVDGVTQDPIQGESFAYTFDDGDAADRHVTQYFEMFGNRGIYHEGWTAVVCHNMSRSDFPADRWELYDTTTDWSQAHDLAAEYPERLAELQALFDIEARKYDVFPLDDRVLARLDAEVAGRDPIPTAETVTLPGHITRVAEHAVPNLKNRSFRIEVHLEAASDEADGVLVMQGNRFAGWSLHLVAGLLIYSYNLAGQEMTHIEAGSTLAAGDHIVEVVSTYDGGGVGRGASVELLVDGAEVASGRLERTIGFFFADNDGVSVGRDPNSPVTDRYANPNGNPFQGRIEKVVLDTSADAVAVPAHQLRESILKST